MRRGFEEVREVGGEGGVGEVGVGVGEEGGDSWGSERVDGEETGDTEEDGERVAW